MTIITIKLTVIITQDITIITTPNLQNHNYNQIHSYNNRKR